MEEGFGSEGPMRGTGRVLIVEDDADISELIVAYLEKEGIPSRAVPSAEAARGLLASGDYALILLDLNLPGMDGLEFLKILRKDSAVPVIVVSARESDEERIRALGMGADDFVPKPFSPRVLAARVSAQLRRDAFRGASGQRLELYTARFGDFVLDRAARMLRRSGAEVPLSRREYELLNFLSSAPGSTYSTEELFHRVWGREYGDISTVAVYIQRLRRKIEENSSSPRFIITTPGQGYRFESGGGEA